jgi:hypothetical protein
MSYQEMQSTMQFILEQQAQYVVLIQKYEERLPQLKKAVAVLDELARKMSARKNDSGEQTRDKKKPGAEPNSSQKDNHEHKD